MALLCNPRVPVVMVVFIGELIVQHFDLEVHIYDVWDSSLIAWWGWEETQILNNFSDVVSQMFDLGFFNFATTIASEIYPLLLFVLL